MEVFSSSKVIFEYPNSVLHLLLSIIFLWTFCDKNIYNKSSQSKCTVYYVLITVAVPAWPVHTMLYDKYALCNMYHKLSLESLAVWEYWYISLINMAKQPCVEVMVCSGKVWWYSTVIPW
jgi:hypothetical protein